MTHRERLIRLKNALGLKWEAVAFMFGVTPSAVYGWLSSEKMAHDCQQTLLRLECENAAKIAPNLSAEALRVFTDRRNVHIEKTLNPSAQRSSK